MTDPGPEGAAPPAVPQAAAREPAPPHDHVRRRSHRQGRARLRTAFVTRIRSARRQSTSWRLAAPVAFVLAGALFVTSAVSSAGTDLRAGRYDGLPGLAQAETRQVEALRQRQAELADEVDLLTEALGDTEAAQAQRVAESLRGSAGLEPVAGPGLTVTLSDAPEAVQDSADTDVNNLVVHQQDIQAVVNALWSGGAEAMTIQGQRVVSTTGVRCVGNTVVLHDVPYAPPYVISAIGPGGDMLASLDASPTIGFYLEAVAAFDLGWEVEPEQRLTFPPYTGSTGLKYAAPLPRDELADDGT